MWLFIHSGKFKFIHVSKRGPMLWLCKTDRSVPSTNNFNNMWYFRDEKWHKKQIGTYISQKNQYHDDAMKWKHLPRYWPFVWRIHRSPVNSSHKGQWRGALIFSLICVWINDWVNNREAGYLRRHRAHYDAIVMTSRHNNLLKISHEKASVVFDNSDVIMRAMTSQITSVSSACSTVCPGTDQSSPSLAFVRGMTAIYRECAGTGRISITCDIVVLIH